MLIETTKQVMKQEGFISANIHKRLDGTRVVNYQWDSKEAFEKRLRNPKAIVHMNEVLSIAKSVEGSLYEVVFVDGRGSIA
jgi:Antibiotic biosynthesis monooxygenase